MSIRAETNSFGIYTKPVTGNAAPRLVYSEGWLYPKQWTSTDLILFDRFLAAGYFDVWTVPADGGAPTIDPTGRDSTGLDRAARPWLEAAWDQMDTRISPDGTLAAYVSSESGQLQIVVQAFPQAGRIWRVSEADTAYSPRSAADGRSLYFWVLSDTSPDTLFQAQIHRNGPDLRIDTPEPVLAMSVAGASGMTAFGGTSILPAGAS